MKAKQILINCVLLFSVCPAWSQGSLIFIYDQQSALETDFSEKAVTNLKLAQPEGQSFTPSFSSVGFVRLSLYDSSGGSQSATIYVALHSDSITGPILGTSDSVSLPAGFGGYPNFLFSTPVSVNPGTTYYLQPILQSGNEGIIESPNPYSGGVEFFRGNPTSSELWFREGMVVPEPSTWALLLLSGGAWALRKWRQ